MKNCQHVLGYKVRLQTVLLLLVALLFSTPPLYAQSDSDAPTGLSPVAQQIFADVNQARADQGLATLTLSNVLSQAAQRHVDDVIANGNWGHYGSDGSNVQLRTARAGYTSNWVSENWVAVREPNQAITWWMNDWIHRTNILAPYWDEVGIGAAQAANGYWILVTDFGNLDGSAPSLAPAPTDLPVNADLVASERVPPGGMDYTIRPGDTLLGIAIRYGLDWQEIAIANGLEEEDLLQIGQVIRLPSIGGTGGPVEAAAKELYIVQQGDTLSSIALRYQLPWQDVAAANSLGEFDLLQIGQTIRIPATGVEDASPGVNDQPVSSSPASRAATSGRSYTVQDGDTVFGIALELGLDWEELLQVNDLKENSLIQPGQLLTLP